MLILDDNTLKNGFIDSKHIREKESSIITRIKGGYSFNVLTEQRNMLAWEELKLMPDTGNTHDCFAVKILRRDNVLFGFLPRQLVTKINIQDWKVYVYPTNIDTQVIGGKGIYIILRHKVRLDDEEFEKIKNEATKI